MLELGTNSISTILCIGAHADDIEIGCGGALLKLLQQNDNVTVHWVVLSGAGDRQAEAEASAARFLENAAKVDVKIASFTDRFFPSESQQIKKYFDELSREVSPDLVLTHRLEDRHQDHRVVAELTWNTFRNHLIMEYEIAKYEGDLGTPNVYVPISEAACQQKIDIIVDSFATQASKPWFSPDTFRALMLLRGLECRSPSQLAEGLYCRKMTI